MSAPRRVHLLAADEALAEGHRPGGYLALCGGPIDTSSLPSARCPDECDCEVTYCPGCLDVATVRNGETGTEVGAPPGITVVTGSRPQARVGEVESLALLLADVVDLAASSAVYPGRLEMVAKLALGHDSVRRMVQDGDR